MAQPTLRQLRTFLAVVEIGNISTAARSLNLTQPAASQQLRELERVLRVRLFMVDPHADDDLQPEPLVRGPQA